MTDPAREPSTPQIGVDAPAWGERSSGGRPPGPPRATRMRKGPGTPPPAPAERVTAVPDLDLPKTDLPKTDLSKIDLSKIDLPEIDLPEIDDADGIDTDTGLPIRTGPDPLGVVAVVIGCLGILVLGLVLAVVAGVLAAEAGRRAKEERRSCELAYWGLAMAGIDGVWWMVMHFVFDLKIWVG